MLEGAEPCGGLRLSDGRTTQEIAKDWATYHTILQIRNPIARIFSAATYLEDEMIDGYQEPRRREVGPSINARAFHQFVCAKLLRPKEVLLDVSDGSERTVNAKKLVNLSVH